MRCQWLSKYSADLVQGGMEIPCLLHFTAKNEKEASKTENLMRSCLVSKGLGEGGQQSASAIIKPVEQLNSMTLGKQFTNTTIDEQVPNECTSNGDAIEMPMDLTGLTEKSPPRKKRKEFDAERIIMGDKLTDLEFSTTFVEGTVQ